MIKQTCPQSALEVLDSGFLETRAHVLEIAALLDRIDRAGAPEKATADFRYHALRRALEILVNTNQDRAQAILLRLSDPTGEPIATAHGIKSAAGAWNGGKR
jgi:hypothetical protein